MTDEAAELRDDEVPENTGEDAEIEESSTSEQEQDPAEQPEEKKPRGVQKRLDELTRNWREEERQRQEWERRYLALEQRLMEQPKPQPKAQSEPKVEDFDTYEAYVDARADYRAEQKLKEWQEQQQQTQTQQQVEQQRADFHQRAMAYAQESGLDDFERTAFSPYLPVSDAMAEAIQNSDSGPQVLYYLGQNPSDAQRISQLPPVQAALEVGRLEAKLAGGPKKVTNAPAPVQPVQGGGGRQTLDPEQMSPEQWLQWRNNQLRSR